MQTQTQTPKWEVKKKFFPQKKLDLNLEKDLGSKSGKPQEALTNLDVLRNGNK